MSRFYLSFKDMIAEYGVDITVYPYSKSADKSHYHYVGGIKAPDERMDSIEPENRHEPVIPLNSKNSILVQYLPGGAKESIDMIWISTKLYPEQTIVKVASQDSKLRVVNFSNYQNYSDVVIYGLKGDDKHPEGR